MTDGFARLQAAVAELVELRRGRLAALSMPNRDLELDLIALEQEARRLDVLDAGEREAVGEAWAALEESFGREEVWGQYPDAAGLLLALRTPGAREAVVSMARGGG